MTLRHDQQPRIVGQQGTATMALFPRPSDELVSIFDVEGRGTSGGNGQPSPFVDKGITEMLAHQAHVKQVVVLNNVLIAPRGVLARGQQPDVAMLQNVLFVRGKLRAFAFAHAQSLKKLREDVPQKVLTS
jgi:hypothetical protein